MRRRAKNDTATGRKGEGGPAADGIKETEEGRVEKIAGTAEPDAAVVRERLLNH